MCENTTIGVLFDLPFRSSSSQASYSAPRLPRPPAFRSTTLTRPMKWTPCLVEAVPAGPARSLAVAVEVGPTWIVVEQVVLAGHEEQGHAGVAEDLVGIVE